MVYEINYWVTLLMGLTGFAIEVWGLIDAARRPARAFVSAEKRTKVFWVALTAAGVFFGYLSIPSMARFGIPFGSGLPWLFMLLAVLPASIYLADVKPEVIRYSGGSSGGSGW